MKNSKEDIEVRRLRGLEATKQMREETRKGERLNEVRRKEEDAKRRGRCPERWRR